ncbi:CpaD family pilus assembly lipoprotein [Vibrio sp. SCSIO 43137]|uniref:CpaD family pilus assembly lipoprotein n=1 Tax=Vibrio sp. SCSIO 43137 TaxID=3021011 RepID=UPI002307C5C7|nr:CpaD family pilus assembly lipoprotein [Vibrio sp. SCSIO 43137]WCE28706.1 CpaD family pilus assembly lipoprotein [Vibrio sp. SCSIO 43137]
MKLIKLFPFTLAFLVGCSSPDPIQHEPSIKVHAVTNSIALKLQGNKVSAQQLSGIERFIGRQGSPYGMKVLLLGKSKTAFRQLSLIEQRLVSKGFTHSQIQLRNEEFAGKGDIKVLIETFRAEVPNCTKETRNALIFNSYKSHSSFGCANAAALAQMVADPRELIVGEKLGATHGETAVNSIKNYVSPVSANSANSGSATTGITATGAGGN